MRPEIKQELFPWATSAVTPDWLYEEIELFRDGERSPFVHSILSSNGWGVGLTACPVKSAWQPPIRLSLSRKRRRPLDPLPPRRGPET